MLLLNHVPNLKLATVFSGYCIMSILVVVVVVRPRKEGKGEGAALSKRSIANLSSAGSGARVRIEPTRFSPTLHGSAALNLR